MIYDDLKKKKKNHFIRTTRILYKLQNLAYTSKAQARDGFDPGA